MLRSAVQKCQITSVDADLLEILNLIAICITDSVMHFKTTRK